MAKAYSIISGKGGVGKTTSVINLGASLNKLGESTIIIDANVSTPNIGLHLGAPVVPITLNQLLSKKAEIADALYQHDSGMKILPSSLSIKDSNCDLEGLLALAGNLKRMSKYIFLDSSAGLGKETTASINASDEVIIITNPEIPSVTDALKSIKLAEDLNKRVAGFILTRFKGKKTEMSVESIQDMLEIPLLGIIPEDKNMQKALSKRDAIVHTHPKSKASKAYKQIAEKLAGKTPEKSFYERIFKK